MILQESPPDSARREGVFRAPNPDFLGAIRNPPDSTASNEPGALSSTGNSCYRNAVVIMLLSTRPIMSFIQNYHRLKILQLEEEPQNISYLNGSSVSAEYYSNLLLELEKLYSTLWETPSTTKTKRLRTEMNKLVSYLKKDDFFEDQFPHNQQSDAGQFLEYFINRCGAELEETTNFLQDAQDWRDLFTLRQTDRKRCRDCWQINHVKHRTEQIQNNNTWTLVMKRFDHLGQEIKQDSFTLDQLLNQWRKTPGESWYCDDCVADFEARFRAKHGHLDKNSAEYKAAKKERDSSNEDWRWYSYVSLPEVLFIDIVRFKGGQWDGSKVVHPPKDQRMVEIPEYVDMAPALDKDVPAEARHSTKYRLRAVIMHAGSVGRAGICTGHYVNYIRAADDQWWYVNEPREVVAVSFEDINIPTGASEWGGNDFTPYLMCYERVNEEGTPTPPAPAPQVQEVTFDSLFDDDSDAEPLQMTSSESRSPESRLPKQAPNAEPAKEETRATSILHLSLTLGSTTYNLTPTIADLSPSLLEEIARGAKPEARWMATLELPPAEEASSKGASKARKGGKGPKKGGKAPARRLIELDPALGRTYLLPSDVTATMRRSTRVAGRRQAAMKKQQEVEEAGGKGKHKSSISSLSPSLTMNTPPPHIHLLSSSPAAGTTTAAIKTEPPTTPTALVKIKRELVDASLSTPEPPRRKDYCYKGRVCGAAVVA
ncbi:hypothetical protein DV735_g4728, partial [Chaetothyriales sp. CBS 134920]